MVKCHYQDCMNTFKNKPFMNTFKNKSFFKFPIQDEPRLKVWIEHSRNEKLASLEYQQLMRHYICEDHFNERDIIRTAVSCRLRPTAVPLMYGLVKSPRLEMKELEIQKPQKVYTKKCMSKKPCVTSKRDTPLSCIDLPMIKDPPDKSFPCIDLPMIKDPSDKSFPCIDLPMIKDPPDKSFPCIDLPMIKDPSDKSLSCIDLPMIKDPSDKSFPCIDLPMIKDPPDKSFPCIDLPMIKDPSDKSLSGIDLPMIKDPSDKNIPCIDLPMPEDSSSSESESSILDEPLYTTLKDRMVDESRKSKSQKNKSQYPIQNIAILQKKIIVLKEKVHRLSMKSKKMKALKEKVRRLSMRTKKKKMMFFETLPFPSQAAKTLAAMQLRGPKIKQWTKEERDLSISIFSRSQCTYRHMKKQGIVLPGKATVQKWLQKMKSTGTTLESNENLQFDFVNCDSDQP